MYDDSLAFPGQHLLWTEQSSPENLDPSIWPRAAVAAEIFWTGATLPDGKPRNVQEALPRIHDLRFRMVNRGVKAVALQPLWCALRPGQCDKVWEEPAQEGGATGRMDQGGLQPQKVLSNEKV
jgi:hexosaminidase